MQTNLTTAGARPVAGNKTPRQILVEARELISDPARWTKGYYARKANSVRADVEEPTACKFCALGAIAKVSGARTHDIDISPAAVVLEVAMGEYPPNFNDSRKHPEVLAAFDKAIASLPTEVSA